MATGELVGCFGLTGPELGSDSSSMLTTAVRDGEGWLLTGAKCWIGLASIDDVAIVWAKTQDGVRGFVVPTDTPGFTATPIEPKLSMRASIQCDIMLTDVRLPADAVLPGGHRPEGLVLLPQRGPIRDHLGRHGRGPRRLRGGPGLRAAP
jgi:glutaryl-CoA dehydrogenase